MNEIKNLVIDLLLNNHNNDYKLNEKNNELHNLFLKEKYKEYVFTEYDKQLANKQAQKKVEECKKIATYDKNPQKIYENFYVGTLGEIAFWRIFSSKLRLIYFNSENWGDEGKDFILVYYNLVADVKTSIFLYSRDNYKIIPIPTVYSKTDFYPVISLENDKTKAIFMGILWKSDILKYRCRHSRSNCTIIGVDKCYIH